MQRENFVPANIEIIAFSKDNIRIQCENGDEATGSEQGGTES